MYVFHSVTGGYTRTTVYQEEWLFAIIQEQHKPKPPEWWLEAQAQKGRTRTSAAIIWGRNYGADRKYLAWSQAPLDDFIRLGYYKEV